MQSSTVKDNINVSLRTDVFIECHIKKPDDYLAFYTLSVSASPFILLSSLAARQ